MKKIREEPWIELDLYQSPRIIRKKKRFEMDMALTKTY